MTKPTKPKQHPLYDGQELRAQIEGVMCEHMMSLATDTTKWTKTEWDSFVEHIAWVVLMWLAEDHVMQHRQRNQGCNDEIPF